MASDYDASEFVDGDFQAHKSPYGGAAQSLRAPTREEVDSKVAQAQQELAEKRRELEECERKRTALEETRRRQMEFETGRQEVVHHLTRGVGLLEEAEFNARRDAEQMAKALSGFRDALSKVQAIREESWTKENLEVELTRALTVLENARMEWNSARLKVPVLSGSALQNPPEAVQAKTPPLMSGESFGQLCRAGLALTWPLAIAVLLTGVALLVVLLRR
jgi:hypothetical protein